LGAPRTGAGWKPPQGKKSLITGIIAAMGRRVVVGIGILLIAAVAGLVPSGCGDEGDSTPFTVSESEVKAECLTATYLPAASAIPAYKKAPPRDWSQIEGAKGAMAAERGGAEVTLRPKPGTEEITITDVRFAVKRYPLRPVGGVFFKPCKRRLMGPAVEANLDVRARVVGSSADRAGELGVGLHLPDSAQPIRFPWTVSLTKPLRFFLVVEARHTYGDWSAHIAWESDSNEGTIRVDNGGKGYRVVDGRATTWYKPVGGKWLVAAESPQWVGVE
jgi:hypothetical protein